ncbi:MAG: diaminopimelate decarboxylase [Kiloniellales bacterium]|nr:diaminopimelate decarboxylase [Kiloniellales bacterium]
MDFFSYRGGQLHAEETPIAAIAESVGTPFYCYASGALETAYRDFAKALEGLPSTICYSLKANGNLALVRTLAALGSGADVVSEGELKRALAAGIPPEKIVFAGVGKTARELGLALDLGILQINVESWPELELLNEIAVQRGKRAPVAIRVNPDVDARTHANISTGRSGHKFGIDIDQAPACFARARDLPGISLEGLAVHIGSQLTDLSPYREAFGRLAELYRELRAAGYPLRRLDLGGGLGIPYKGEPPADLGEYAAIVGETTGSLGADLIFEPGRLLVGNAGILVSRVIYVKEGSARRYVIMDAAMNDLIRPMLYQAWHTILPVKEAPFGAETSPCDVVGPICETTDTFARERDLPALEQGDLLAIFSTGAYGAVMSSTYNARSPAPEVLVRGHEHAVIRPRRDLAALIEEDRLPTWLAEPAGAGTEGIARGPV